MSYQEVITMYKKLKPEDQDFILFLVQVLAETHNSELVEKMAAEYLAK